MGLAGKKSSIFPKNGPRRAKYLSSNTNWPSFATYECCEYETRSNLFFPEESMFKKLTLAALAVLLVGGLLFGRNLIPYAATAYDNVSKAANDMIPVEHQIDAARKQLQQIGPEIKSMRHDIAKEKVAVRKLDKQLIAQRDNLDSQYSKIMALRDHLETGDTHFVSRGNSYSNDRVKSDLEYRFRNYKTCEQTVEKLERILDIRKQGLGAAELRLEETISQQRELEVQIENLAARQQMLEVEKTAMKINFENDNNTQIARTREMLENIENRIEVDTQMLNLTPDATGTIPMGEEETSFDGDIVNEIDSYFNEEVSSK